MKSETTKEQRDAAVLAVLKRVKKPIGPTDIARKINKQWCMSEYGTAWAVPASSAISSVLKRIGAVSSAGKWSLPKVES